MDVRSPAIGQNPKKQRNYGKHGAAFGRNQTLLTTKKHKKTQKGYRPGEKII